MTILEDAINEIKSYPPIEQNRIAKWLLEELKSNQKWEKSFADSEDFLEQLANEALEEDREGKTTILDPDKL